MESYFSWGSSFRNLMFQAYLEAVETHKKLGIDMSQDIAAYSLHGGYVFIAPNHIMWGKPVRQDGGDPDNQWNVVDPDAWYVRFACGKGSLGRFVALMPYTLPYVGWKRQLKGRGIKYFKTTQIRKDE